MAAKAEVPVKRGGRSGATATPFRRNGIAVPAQRHRRSGATASPFRRDPEDRSHKKQTPTGDKRLRQRFA